MSSVATYAGVWLAAVATVTALVVVRRRRQRRKVAASTAPTHLLQALHRVEAIVHHTITPAVASERPDASEAAAVQRLIDYLACADGSQSAESQARLLDTVSSHRGPFVLFGSNDLSGLELLVDMVVSAVRLGIVSAGPCPRFSNVVVITGGVGHSSPSLLRQAARAVPSVADGLAFPETASALGTEGGNDTAGVTAAAAIAKSVATHDETEGLVGCTDIERVRSFVSEGDVFCELLLLRLRAALPHTTVEIVTHPPVSSGDEGAARCVRASWACFNDSSRVLIVLDNASTHTGQNVEYTHRLLRDQCGLPAADIAIIAGQSLAFQKWALMRRSCATMHHRLGAPPTLPLSFPPVYGTLPPLMRARCALQAIEELGKVWRYRQRELGGCGFIVLPEGFDTAWRPCVDAFAGEEGGAALLDLRRAVGAAAVAAAEDAEADEVDVRARKHGGELLSRLRRQHT